MTRHNLIYQRQARAAKLSQEELAARIGRQQSYIPKQERVERRLDAIELLGVVDAIGFGIGEIFSELRAVRGAPRRAQAEAVKRGNQSSKLRKNAAAASAEKTPRKASKPRAN